MKKRILAVLLTLSLLLPFGLGGISMQAAGLAAVDENNAQVFVDPEKENITPVPKQQHGLETAQSLADTRVYNDFIAISVNPSTGRYTIGTTGGDPTISTDNNVKLLYGYPSTGTTYTTLHIDGINHIYGEDGSFSASPRFDNDTLSNTSAVNYDGITVKQIVRIVNNNSTNRADVVEIKYEVTNNTSTAHNIGTRIMLDTMVDGNDYAPFRIPGIGDVTTQTEFTGSNIPQFWQAFDSLTNPRAISQGSFLRSSANPPNKVQFTNWSKVYNTSWNASVSTGSANGDSAVTVTWNEQSLPAGQTRSYVTHYGLSQFQSDLRPPLAVSVYSDNLINVINRNYSPNPIDITAYIKNIGSAAATNAYVLIRPGTGTSLASGSVARISLGTVAVGEQRQLSWKLQLDSVTTDTERTFVIETGADNQATKTLTQTILVPSIYRDDSGDTDGDGLLDSWERNGADFNADGIIDLPLHQMGADPNIKDVFVEVDWIQGSDPITAEYFDAVAEEFERHNIRLHIDAGPNSIDFVTGKKWSTYPGGSGAGAIPYVDEENSFDRMEEIANANFTRSRTRAFHYCTFAENLGGAGGWGYVQGQLFMVLATMSDWAKGAAFMHELGHNLNLQHGGDDAQNNKPNYLSNMNYIFSYSDDLSYKYSDFDLFDIDENNLNELDGVDPTGLTRGTGIHTALMVDGSTQYFLASETPLDYNHDNDTNDTNVSADISNRSQATQQDADVSYDVLTSQNDWDALVFKGQDIGTVGSTIGVSFEPNDPNLVIPNEPKIDDLRNVGLFPAKAEGTDTKHYFILWGKVTRWEKTLLNWLLLIICFGWIWMAF